MPKISELPLANKLKEEDYIPIVQDGVTKKVKGTHFVTEEEYSLDAFSPTIVANDKAMYKFGEGDNVDFSESAYDGAYKSAILKGNTLVNLYKIRGQEVDDEKIWANNTVSSLYSEGIYFIKNNTPHRITIGVYQIEPTIYADILYLEGDSYLKVELEDNRFFYQFLCKFSDGWTSEDDLSRAVTILQYQEGMENWDIPYFEGMQSVKMPVLQTTGRNIIKPFEEWKKGGSGATYTITGKRLEINATEWNSRVGITQQLKPNTTYSVGWDEIENVTFNFSNTNRTTDSSPFPSFTTNESGKVTFILKNSVQKCTMVIDGFRINEGNTDLGYEPYKSNILSTPSDLVLGGVGDVQDTLNVLTGEVTQTVGKVVYDGTESLWKMSDDSFENIVVFQRNRPTDSISSGLTINNIMCDKAPITDPYNGIEGIRFYNGNGQVMLGVRRDNLTEISAIGLREYLTANPITVQYPLAEKVHKTVDLSGTPFGYKGGHIIKSSAEGSLLPKFEYEVAVSRGAQISQNTSTLIKHDEKITELLKKTAATYINQKAEIAHLLNMSNTLEEAQTIPFIEDDYVNDDCMVDSDMVMDDMELEHEKEIIDNVDTLLINLIYDLIELNDTLDLLEKVELFRQSGLIDKHNYEIIKEKLNPSFKEEDYADINQ